MSFQPTSLGAVMGFRDNLESRVNALERGMKLIHDMTKIERVAYLATNSVLVLVLIAVIFYAFVFDKSETGSDLKKISILVGGGGGSIVAVLTWRTLRVWDRYFRALERLLENSPDQSAASSTRPSGVSHGRASTKHS